MVLVWSESYLRLLFWLNLCDRGGLTFLGEFGGLFWLEVVCGVCLRFNEKLTLHFNGKRH